MDHSSTMGRAFGIIAAAGALVAVTVVALAIHATAPAGADAARASAAGSARSEMDGLRTEVARLRGELDAVRRDRYVLRAADREENRRASRCAEAGEAPAGHPHESLAAGR